MKKKNKIIIIAIIFALIILCGGLSFAYFTSITPSESTSTIYAKGGTMNIRYDNGSGDIIVDNIYPREKEWVNKTFTVTGENTTDLEMDYKIYLKTQSNGFNLGDLTYSLSGSSTNVDDFLSSKENQQLPKNGEILIGSGTFKSKTAIHSYSLKIFYKETGENQNNGQEKNYTGYVRIDTGNSLAYNTLVNQSKSKYYDAPAFNGPITKSEVEAITFKSDVIVPSTALLSWDASEKQNGSVMAYALDEDNNNLYELYIGQDDKIVLGSDASYLFAMYDKSTKLDVSNLDTSKVTNMSYMFYICKATEIKGLTLFNTTNVTNMASMFQMTRAESLNLSSFDTSKVTDMSYMFDNVPTKSLNLSGFNTSNVTNMEAMFFGSNATNIDLSSFDTSKVTDMSDMFGYSQVTSLDLSNFDTSKVTDMSWMFSSSQATSLDLSNFDTSNVTNMQYMFSKAQAKNINFDGFNTSRVTDMSSMFQGAKATNIDLSSFDTSNVTSMRKMFEDYQATKLNLSNLNTSKVTDMTEMFRNSQTMSLNLSSFNTSNVTKMSYMFADSQATSINLSSFNTSNVDSMDSMFQNSQATSLDLSSFDTSKLIYSYNMFYNCKATIGYARTQKDANKFNTSRNKPSTLTFKVK